MEGRRPRSRICWMEGDRDFLALSLTCVLRAADNNEAAEVAWIKFLATSLHGRLMVVVVELEQNCKLA
jgi:hypothetical protein